MGWSKKGDGGAVAGALVLLRARDESTGAGPYQALSTPEGAFVIADVAPGDYGVWVVPGRHAAPFMRPSDLAPTSLPALGEPQRHISVADEPLTLELTLDGLLSISGTVRGLDGDLIADARVFAARGAGDRRYDPTGQPTLTDREGRFTIEELAPGEYALTAYRREGGAVREFGVKAGSAGVDLVFPDTGRMEGQVKYAESGEPVVAFRLVVEGPDGYTDPFVPVGSKEGRFVVNDLPPATYTVHAVAPEGVAETRVTIGPGEAKTDIELHIREQARLKGRLVDESGQPRARWIVALVDASAPQSNDNRPIYGEITDTQGRFDIDHLAAMEYKMLVMPAPPDAPPDPQTVAAAPQLRRVQLEESQELDLGDVMAPTPAN